MTERLSQQALCPNAEGSQLLPTPVGSHRIKLSWASIAALGELEEQRATEAARGSPTGASIMRKGAS